MVYFYLRGSTFNLLEKTGMLGCKPASTPIEANMDLWCDNSYLLDDPGQYRRLIEKLINLTVTSSDIIFAVGVLSRFIHQPREEVH